MITTTEEQVSTFARIVDKLRLMDEAELKHAYLRLFQDEIEKEWMDITKDMDFGDTTDEDIVKAIQENRLKRHEP